MTSPAHNGYTSAHQGVIDLKNNRECVRVCALQLHVLVHYFNESRRPWQRTQPPLRNTQTHTHTLGGLRGDTGSAAAVILTMINGKETGWDGFVSVCVDINCPPEQSSDNVFNGSISINFTSKTCTGMCAHAHNYCLVHMLRFPHPAPSTPPSSLLPLHWPRFLQLISAVPSPPFRLIQFLFQTTV